MGMVAADWVVVAVYFGALIATGIMSSFQNRGSVGGYFLAGQNVHFALVGASLFASNIGSGLFIGLAGSGAKDGIVVSAYELHAVYVLFMLGWVFLPVYKASGIYTMPEYLYKRFGGRRIRVYLAIISLVLYVTSKIAADLYAGSVFMDQALPGTTSLYVWVIILVVIAAIFTITGGLTAVMWTDTIQTVIMTVGAFVLMIISFKEVGGYDEMKRKYPLSLPNSAILNSSNPTYKYRTCNRPSKYWFQLMWPVDEGTPWTGLVFGLTVNAMWYWCNDQVIVQRVLAAKNMTHAKLGCVVASYLKITTMWLIIFPGMISRILYPNEVACNEPARCQQVCGKDNCADIAYPLLVVRLMPTGVLGLMMATMMSALISSLTSIFNSTSTIFTIDIWHRVRKGASDVELMLVGRLAVLVLIVISIIWVPVVRQKKTLFDYIQKMTAYLGAPVCATYVVAVLWNRATEPAIFWSMMSGTTVGVGRFIWEQFGVAEAKCGEDVTQPAGADAVLKLHFLHFGALLFAFTALLIVAISLVTKVPDEKFYMGMTFSTRHCPHVGEKDEYVEKDLPPQYFRKLMGDKTLQQQPFRVRVILWVCGVEDMVQPATNAVVDTMDRSIFEETRMSYVMHVNIGIALVFITAYWTFFSV
ncbi:sodium/glucose cotransporter 4-like [Littorina saxatilis]|uniref:Sodium/glucose cotransporter 5 n=1 Tax=Littorina saxatilis TaxID=31220 RepID=A0AAN9G3N8_9CAEN